MAVESDADLRRDVGKQKCLVHGVLRERGVCGGHPVPTPLAHARRRRENAHVSAVIPALEVVLELGAEQGRERVVFGKRRARPADPLFLGNPRLAQRSKREVFGRLWQPSG